MFNENASKLDDIQRWYAQQNRFVDEMGVAAMDEDCSRYRITGGVVAEVFPLLLVYLRHAQPT